MTGALVLDIDGTEVKNEQTRSDTLGKQLSRLIHRSHHVRPQPG
jgi:hypothetical protein